MNRFTKAALLALCAFAPLSAMAVDKDITIVADVDPTLEILQADGSALPSTLRMNYIPGRGLQNASILTRILTNDVSKDLTMRLVTAPVLANMLNPATPGVPLSATYGGQALSATTPVTLTATSLFPGATTGEGSSVTQQLEVRQTTAGVLAAGSYQGVVSIVLTQVP